MTKKILIGIMLLTAATGAVAQTGRAGRDIAILNAGVGARALGMGSAFTAVADNADAPYWNPAGLGSIKKNKITTMQTKLSTDADHYYLSYVRPALGGTLGISWIQVGLGSITQTSAEVDTHNEVVDLSVFSYFSDAYLISYGKAITDNISLGLSGKYLTSNMFQIDNAQAYGYSLTPGILLRLGNKLSVGVKIDELINRQTWGTGTTEQVPAKLRLGLAYQAPNPGLIALDFSQILKDGYPPKASVGYEWKKDDLAIRFGYTDDGLTAGAGFASGHTQVDYAYVTQSELSVENVHRISLSGKW